MQDQFSSATVSKNRWPCDLSHTLLGNTRWRVQSCDRYSQNLHAIFANPTYLVTNSNACQRPSGWDGVSSFQRFSKGARESYSDTKTWHVMPSQNVGCTGSLLVFRSFAGIIRRGVAGRLLRHGDECERRGDDVDGEHGGDARNNGG